MGGSGANSERRQSSFEEPASGERLDHNSDDHQNQHYDYDVRYDDYERF